MYKTKRKKAFKTKQNAGFHGAKIKTFLAAKVSEDKKYRAYSTQ